MELLDDGRLWELPRCSATSMDVRFALRHGGANTTGLAVLDCRGEEGPRSAAIVYDWHTDELRVTYNEYLVHTKRETFRWGFLQLHAVLGTGLPGTVSHADGCHSREPGGHDGPVGRTSAP